MLIYVFNLRKKILLLLLPLGIIILAIIIGTIDRNIIGVFTQTKELPIYSVESTEKKVAITFDCAWGADDITDILNVLKKEDIKVTFFIVGQWAEKYAEKVKEISIAGHDIANHSYSHLRMSTLDKSRLTFEIAEANKKLSDISGNDIKLFRAPYGDYNNNVISTARDLGLQTIQWDVDSLDWKPGISESEILNRIFRKVVPGSIILFHNDTAHTAKILPSVIEQLKSKGYSFLPVSKMILKDNYIIDYSGRQKVKE
jgi:peptidoglycan-N-acetylglucosamine deacetylase